MSASADISRLLRGAGQAKARAIAAARRALDVFGEMVVGNAQQLTPVDTGALQASGTTLPAEEKGQKLTKVVGFNTNYAAAVHERLELYHEHGQAKFLETAVRELRPRFQPFIAAKVRAALEGGGA